MGRRRAERVKRASAAPRPPGRLPALIVGLSWWWRRRDAWQAGVRNSDHTAAEVGILALSQLAQTGAAAFDRNRATCHGRNAAGGAGGPHLVHDIYNPGHHADLAFLRAVRQGVPQHHWRFVNMPAQPEISDDQVAAIVHYMPELQTAKGIRYRPHHH